MSQEEPKPNPNPEAGHPNLNFLAPYVLLSVAEMAALEISGGWDVFANGGFASCLIVFLAAANYGIANRAAGFLNRRSTS